MQRELVPTDLLNPEINIAAALEIINRTGLMGVVAGLRGGAADGKPIQNMRIKGLRSSPFCPYI
jgi:hypothetical protein